MPNPHITEATAADIAIVGLGPGGLSAALQAAVDGRAVVAFTDRSQYIRGQSLILSAEAEEFLLAHEDKSDPIDALFWKKYNPEGSAQTKDIELARG